ncbi:bifunctional phosphopantothenoylcysteine decarboxylase/phosphopantothenate--cysteine ligase CoaBC [Terriglobus tenax]|uniref:bifunctional phosphopantothenoylcysteine decarboxylase/phosphopantothenate--cysteine ligase CoaBC n=1 Tax=Terriglobus tenax TaxID=1111115 RepID=UPI0021E042B0|nr:bifunctional phosphopantothenoylcysteine decarboxylase/phosphopantothenate--cysteine ligase CoaBC [Terriglobus tenax]
MKVLLGVCGGIAAYKAAELLRELQRQGAEVQVVLTQGAEKFITPLTFAALSGRQVLTSLWNPAVSDSASAEMPQPFGIEHIDIAQWADVLVIAPATAHMLAKLAHGMADDLLSTIALATTAPIVVAPAMNVNMWHNAATQANLKTLRSRGVHLVEPASGELACGMVGEGRLAEIGEIASAILHAANPIRDLAGERILITAGGTREAVDPVRYLGNRSSGKMGIALAEAALARGAEVTLITTTGRVSSLRCKQIQVESAEQMRTAVLHHLPQATTLIMAAAVADYRVATPSEQKIKKSSEHLTLELERTPDILSEAARLRLPGTLIIGFAAETRHVSEEGRRKLREKDVDAIVANDVSGTESGIGADLNGGTMLFADREVTLPLSTKRKMAESILHELATLRVDRLQRIS